MADQQQIFGNYQISSGTIQRGLLDFVTPNQSVVGKIVVSGSFIGMSYTGADPGTGDVLLIVTGTSPYLTTGSMPINGWIAQPSTWICQSTDSPIFNVTVNSNITGTIGLGNRIWLQQSGADKFFLVHGVGISGSTSWLNLYGGTDYALITGAITSPQYSPIKAPFGFPLTPSKWTGEFTDTTNAQHASPSSNVWYNLHSLTVPLGVWRLTWVATQYCTGNGAQYLTLSTTNNGETDTDLTQSAVALGATITSMISPSAKSKILSLLSKAIYYFNTKTSQSGMTSIGTAGTVEKTRIAYESVYL